MQKTPLQLVISASSHRGQVRTTNQDAYGYSVAGRCFAVCDGMGGAAGGEVASRVALESFLDRLGGPDAGTPIARRIEQAVQAANRILYTRASREPALHGMGTTLVALVLVPESREGKGGKGKDGHPVRTPALEHAQDGSEVPARTIPLELHSPAHVADTSVQASLPGGRAWVAHVGDSRCYRLRGGLLERCTADHSLVEEQVRLGQLTAKEAARSPMRNVITRAVGVGKSVAVELRELDVQAGDLFLLCSDGLTREVTESRIAEMLEGWPAVESEEQGASLADTLVAEALAAGGSDNITCLTVRCLAPTLD